MPSKKSLELAAYKGELNKLLNTEEPKEKWGQEIFSYCIYVATYKHLLTMIALVAKQMRHTIYKLLNDTNVWSALWYFFYYYLLPILNKSTDKD